MGLKSISSYCFKVLKNQRKQVFGITSFELLSSISSKEFFQLFSKEHHFQKFCFLTSLSYSLQNLSFRILYCERYCLWSLWSSSVVTTLFALCFGFVPSLLCRGDLLCALALLCTFCIEIVSFMEFLSRDSRNPSHGEGGYVELGARVSKHILVFVFVLSLSQLYSCYILHFNYCNTYMFVIVYVLTLV